jgi:hypothetical protein
MPTTRRATQRAGSSKRIPWWNQGNVGMHMRQSESGF